MNKIFDVAIIGGGIAGLSASICSSSEGFTTVVCDSAPHFGGQAGSASLIENLLGFPKGVTGKHLTESSVEQAEKFGVVFKSPFRASKLEKDGMMWKVISEDDEVITAKTILLTIGLGHRKMESDSISRYLGMGVNYGSPDIEEDFDGQTVSIVGGANSAGQAAVYLASCEDCTVNLIVRADAIEKGMSHYLCEKIRNTPNINVHLNCEVAEANGKHHLDELTLKCPDGNVKIKSDKLFILIGSLPKTNWLRGTVPMDEHGFIITDDNMMAVEGVFSAGDVRSASIKRVSCALGEGSRTIKGIRERVMKVDESLTLA